ncbi:hypothetical protein CTI12_AA563350 [Artemisia annua]|uniref:Uncharacterized protein n=1 Tax=Artemisia annua TaxID=35608 RepID=A0A2U1KUC3_ARTAN|nr:hypothetical protein CTI12_AA563350 [Artemisia annua]
MFDNDKVQPLCSEEAQNSWSLVAVTLTANVVALLNIAKDNVKGLLMACEGKKNQKTFLNGWVIQQTSNKDGSLDYSHENVLAVNTIYILACFTNLPCVITMKCHHDAIEKRQGSIRTAARILGKSKMILNILKERQLPNNLDMDSMVYLDKWHALLKSQILQVV